MSARPPSLPQVAGLDQFNGRKRKRVERRLVQGLPEPRLNNNYQITSQINNSLPPAKLKQELLAEIKDSDLKKVIQAYFSDRQEMEELLGREITITNSVSKEKGSFTIIDWYRNLFAENTGVNHDLDKLMKALDQAQLKGKEGGLLRKTFSRSGFAVLRTKLALDYIRLAYKWEQGQKFSGQPIIQKYDSCQESKQHQQCNSGADFVVWLNGLDSDLKIKVRADEPRAKDLAQSGRLLILKEVVNSKESFLSFARRVVNLLVEPLT